VLCLLQSNLITAIKLVISNSCQDNTASSVDKYQQVRVCGRGWYADTVDSLWRASRANVMCEETRKGHVDLGGRHFMDNLQVKMEIIDSYLEQKN